MFRFDVLLLSLSLMTAWSLAGPAKLGHLPPQGSVNRNVFRNQYSPPLVPSGLYDLPAPAPVRTTPHRRITTTPRPPPGLYETPYDGDQSNLNPNFIAGPVRTTRRRITTTPRPPPGLYETPYDGDQSNLNPNFIAGPVRTTRRRFTTTTAPLPPPPSGLYDTPFDGDQTNFNPNFISLPKPTTRRRTTTTPLPPPPPPSGLYDTPFDGRQSNLNPNFISFPEPLEVPKFEIRATPTPATVPTPKGFSPPPLDPKFKGMMGPYMPYKLAWGVRDSESGNMFSHSEHSEGNDVQGEYRVLLPDGRMQVVNFWADPESGYNARVTYQ